MCGLKKFTTQHNLTAEFNFSCNFFFFYADDVEFVPNLVLGITDNDCIFSVGLESGTPLKNK